MISVEFETRTCRNEPHFVFCSVMKCPRPNEDSAKTPGFSWWTHKGSNLGPLPCEGKGQKGHVANESSTVSVAVTVAVQKNQFRQYKKCPIVMVGPAGLEPATRPL
jgi:hypothetical protein